MKFKDTDVPLPVKADCGLCVSAEHEDALFDSPVSDRALLVDGDASIEPIAGSKLALNSKETELVLLLRDTARMVRRIASAKYTIFKLTQRRKFGKIHDAISKTGLAGEVCRILRRLSLDELRMYFPQHQFNPFVDLWFELLLERPRLICAGSNWDDLLDDDATGVVAELNELAEAIQSAAKTPQFRAQFDLHRRRCARNYKALCDYINALFKHKGKRHLVIRLDFGYRKDAAPMGLLTPTSISLKDARQHLARLIRHVRNHYPLTGYAWKLEYGLQKDYHFHVLIFLNGRLVQQDVPLARLIGQHWNTVITEGHGSYFNCNAVPYKYRGVGMVDHKDAQKRIVLIEYVAPYLTKVDFWMYFDPPGKTFGKGLMPKAARKTETTGKHQRAA
jgi:hypothetical protein